jgi:hypothetical protein
MAENNAPAGFCAPQRGIVAAVMADAGYVEPFKFEIAIPEWGGGF